MKSLKNISFSLLLLFGSCPYNNFVTYTLKDKDNFVNYYYSEHKGNELPKDNLIIFLGGSEYCSTLGIKGAYGSWEAFTPAISLNDFLSERFDVLIPEKININMGEDFSADSLKAIANTLFGRIRSSLIVIDNFLSIQSYDEVFLIGFSEGGLILPKVYNSLKTKKKITGLVSISCGGYSYYNIIKSKYKSHKLSTTIIDSIIAVINKEPNSLSKSAFGQKYVKWRDFMYYEPAEEYKNIQVPVLLIHGTKDQYSPIESAWYLRNKFIQWNKHNLTYIEIEEAEHNFNVDFKPVIKEIEKWIVGLNE